MVIEPERHIHLLLISTPRVARLSGFNVYQIGVPKNAEWPFVVYKRANTSREAALATPLYAPMTSLQVACWAYSPEVARELGDEVRLLLDGHIGTLSNATIQDMRLISEVDDFIDPTVQGQQLPPAYEVRQLYQFRWQEATQ